MSAPPKRPKTRPTGDRKARFGYNSAMRAVLKTIDPVILSYAANVLAQEGIESVVFDTHASVMDGSMGVSAAPADGAGRGFRPRRDSCCAQARAGSHAVSA